MRSGTQCRRKKLQNVTDVFPKRGKKHDFRDTERSLSEGNSSQVPEEAWKRYGLRMFMPFEKEMKKVKRNPFLTPAMERVLRWMIAEGPEGELVEEGREVWYGLERTSPAVVKRLLRLCLIRDETPDGAMTETRYRYYSVNEEGVKIVNDPSYKPKILEAMAEYLKRK